MCGFSNSILGRGDAVKSNRSGRQCFTLRENSIIKMDSGEPGNSGGITALDWMKGVQIIKKYKWPAVILLVGLVLILLPGSSGSETQDRGIIEEPDNILSVEEALSEILSKVQGAGKVRVMLTVASGEETTYQCNSSISENGSERIDTVIISDSDRKEQGLIKQINPPVYLGAIVVCQGADSPAVRWNIIEAVSAVTGLRTDKISVLKMN